jgi:hypothetical protein
MTLHAFLEKLNQYPQAITFAETIATIESNYDFTPTAFQNEKQHNGAGENSGSCKLFAFAKIQELSQAATLSCFGAYYFEEVLGDPQGPTTKTFAILCNRVGTEFNLKAKH